MFKLKYSLKFYLGAILFIFSFILAKITFTTFILYYNQIWIRWLSIITYALTWVMLAVGVWWIGKEYAKALNRYFTYKFYHEKVKSGTKQAIHRTKKRTKRAIHQTKKIHSRVKLGVKNRFQKSKLYKLKQSQTKKL